MPSATRSSETATTMGMVVVACLAASAPGVVLATITSGWSWTNPGSEAGEPVPLPRGVARSRRMVCPPRSRGCAGLAGRREPLLGSRVKRRVSRSEHADDGDVSRRLGLGGEWRHWDATDEREETPDRVPMLGWLPHVGSLGMPASTIEPVDRSVHSHLRAAQTLLSFSCRCLFHLHAA